MFEAGAGKLTMFNLTCKRAVRREYGFAPTIRLSGVKQ
jgi:hypothetical protein